ncbi:hypothetical protein [Mycoplasmopsis felis]|uniref:hypothetical protein n=1 Tax=Mycoplasmopsis felis TaxID=33923 RepID=UPI0013749880|nr:hypothetical protein [Mycoplasmopsis felis]
MYWIIFNALKGVVFRLDGLPSDWPYKTKYNSWLVVSYSFNELSILKYWLSFELLNGILYKVFAPSEASRSSVSLNSWNSWLIWFIVVNLPVFVKVITLLKSILFGFFIEKSLSCQKLFMIIEYSFDRFSLDLNLKINS